MLNITDNELAEGVFGGIACIVFLKYYEKYLIKRKMSVAMSGLIGWMLFWWLRKALMNFYKDQKKKHGLKDKKYSIF